jgi:hypothetical protein
MKAANLHKQTFALMAALLILLPGLTHAAADPHPPLGEILTLPRCLSDAGQDL